MLLQKAIQHSLIAVVFPLPVPLLCLMVYHMLSHRSVI
ncbi:unnamed protein product [Oppiella nova]|uniref:Uncharacterized protein n=1 Tax=Oppiella nova TaxID=334625 RepID=A0A7R9MR17_9ACAR|nr:unnamed protein product [Oppiella nova]CAG2182079.1 unnamed protein product [Oppiella nova]